MAKASSIPLAWFSDPKVFSLEQERIFTPAHGYVGHALMVPEEGDVAPLEGRAGGWILSRAGAQPESIRLLANTCRHRQARLIDEPCKLSALTCPIHRWTYGLDGTFLGAPHFNPQPENKNLFSKPLRSWNDFLFAGSRDPGADLAGFTEPERFSLKGWKFHSQKSWRLKSNWKTFIEVYLDLYHVEPFHDGLSNFVDCAKSSWKFGLLWSCQKLPAKGALAGAPGSAAYAPWHKEILHRFGPKGPSFGSRWHFYYPNLMIEIFPDALCASWLVPLGPQETLNIVEFYYPEDVVLFEPEYIQAQQGAYNETAREDELICERMEEGRKTLLDERLSDAGPLHPELEAGFEHFHALLWNDLEDALE